MRTIHRVEERVIDSNQALQYLRAGNERYVNEKFQKVDTLENDRKQFTDGQNPFAVVLTCSDSRVAPEIFFDQKLGDIFVIRNAGNVVDDTVLASIQYAVANLEVPLVVVVGHSDCGAVGAAISDTKLEGELESLIHQIEIAIAGEDDSNAVFANTEASVAAIKANEVIQKFSPKVVGAYYNVVDGKVIWQGAK